MDSPAIPGVLKDRLGPDATDGLRRLLDQVRDDLREDVITACSDRFERRLVEEVSGVRVQIAQVESSIRQDLTRLGAELRQEMTQLGSELRREMAQQGSEIRQEIAQLGSELRQEIAVLGTGLSHEIAGVSSRMATDRFELLKWAFLFWIGQVVAVGTLFGIIMRLSGRP